MISDSINNYHRYPFGPTWQAAFTFIKSLTPDKETGKHLIQGDRVYAGIDTYPTRSRETAKLETHRKYVDIQLLLIGEEMIEVFPRDGLRVSEPYNSDRDAEFYRVPPDVPARMVLTPGRFLVFFPEDAHMPCLSVGNSPQSVKKVVIKVAVELLAC